MKVHIIIISIFISSFVSAQTTKGKEFWFAFMENLDLSSNGPPTFYLYISSEYNTTGTVKLPSGWVQSFSVSPNHVSEVVLPPSIFYGHGYDTITTNYGFKIETVDSCTAYVLHRRAYFSEATLVLPIEELSTEYLVMAHWDESQNGGRSEFVVEATEDSSLIEITPSQFSTSLFIPPNIPFQIVLNKGQTFQFQSLYDLTSSSVKCLNHKKIAVFGGLTDGIVSVINASHMYEQVLPYSCWGTDFVFIPTDSMNYDKLKFLARDAGTNIYLDTTLLATLNAANGVCMTNYSAAPTYIHSNYPITVSKLCKGGTGSMQGYMGDPNLVSLLPLNFNQNKLKVQLRAISSIQSNFFNIVAKTNDVSKILYDSVMIDTTKFHPLLFLPCYSYAQFRIDTLFHTLESIKGFNTTVETFEWFDAYTFSGGYSSKNILDSNHCSNAEPTGIMESKINDFSIWPNPSTGNINFHINANEKFVISIYDEIGNLIYEKQSSDRNRDVTLNNLKSGIYFYSISFRYSNIKSGKFIVSN